MNLAPLASGAEFDKIRSIWRMLGERGTGGGDDAAIVDIGSGRVAIATDMMLEDVHFKLGWINSREIGWRAGAAALSDLAAVAATPRGVLVSLGVPADWPDDLVADLMGGVGDVVVSVGATVVGGDLVRSDKIVLDVAVFGEVTEPVLRSGARVGDSLWVTGRLGGPFTAFEAWNDGREPDRAARERFAAPTPRVKEARWLRDHDCSAMIDISDGLAQDAEHLGEASNVRWRVDAEIVPAHASVTCSSVPLFSGEEFELLVALPPGFDADLSSEFEELFGLAFTRIGFAEEGRGVCVFENDLPIDVLGFQHF